MRRKGCDGIVCCLGCLSLVPGVSRRIVSKAAFFPPKPCGYIVSSELVNENSQESNISKTNVESSSSITNSTASFCRLTNTKKSIRSDDNTSIAETCNPVKCQVVYLVDVGQFNFVNGRGYMYRLPSVDITPFGIIHINHVEIPCMGYQPVHAFHLTRPDASHTLIFSHGNSTDIGIMFPWLLELCRLLEVNIIAYDFSGYGACGGTPSESALYTNIAGVYEYLTGLSSITPNRIILYGQSIGSAPSIDLATKAKDIAGLIIHSGMKSGLTVLKSDYRHVHWFDAFQNFHKIKKVQCPIFIIHGQNDRDIDILHGHDLFEVAPTAEYWWVEGAGHNDIEVLHRREYFVRMRTFLNSIGAYTHKKTPPAIKGKTEKKIESVNYLTKQTLPDVERSVTSVSSQVGAYIGSVKDTTTGRWPTQVHPIKSDSQIEVKKLQLFAKLAECVMDPHSSLKSDVSSKSTTIADNLTPKRTARDIHDIKGQSRIPLPPKSVTPNARYQQTT